MREEALPALSAIHDERVKKFCEIAKAICREAERVIAAVDPRFITERKGKEKKSS